MGQNDRARPQLGIFQATNPGNLKIPLTGRFLDGVRDADDVTGYMEQVRQTKASIPRRKLRSLVRHDADPATLTSVPESVSLSRGRLEVSFRSVKQLGEAMYWLAQMLDTDEFAREFEPEPPPAPEPEDAGEMGEMFAELERLEAERVTKR